MGRIMINTTMTNAEYRSAKGISNSELLMIGRSPADYIWNMNAPTDAAKVQAKDFGTALHTAILEPDLFESTVLVSSVKGRQTKTFEQEITDNPDKVVLTEQEADQIRIMKASAMAHPVFARIINQSKLREVSIFARDEARDIDLKIRPDIDMVESHGFIADLKTTALLDDWRSDKQWSNPLIKLNYGHTAAFYLHTASLHYGFDVNVYKFMVVQKTVSLSRYPVSVFTVDRDYLIANGFWQQMEQNLDVYAKCLHENKWDFDELMPMFVKDEEINISFEE
jgi:hypothetical protein